MYGWRHYRTDLCAKTSEWVLQGYQNMHAHGTLSPPAQHGWGVRTYWSVPTAEHEAPATNCTCGFYGFWDPGNKEIGSHYGVLVYTQGLERVFRHEKGWRAMRVRLIAAFLYEEKDNVPGICDRLGLPLAIGEADTNHLLQVNDLGHLKFNDLFPKTIEYAA